MLSAVWLALTTNWLAAGLSVAAIAFYVLVYTLLLKRRTSQNIVWGGAAGCMPVVIGWAAVTGTVEWPALVMFGVIFFWTPPHFWALAMRYREDYAAAGVPMLPVVATAGAGVAADRRLLLGDGRVDAAAAPGHVVDLRRRSRCWAGLVFVLRAHRLHRGGGRRRSRAPMRLFHLSNMYLCVLFAAIAVDAAIGLPASCFLLTQRVVRERASPGTTTSRARAFMPGSGGRDEAVAGRARTCCAAPWSKSR